MIPKSYVYFFFYKARSHGLEDVPQEVATLISHATQERLRNVLEKLATIAEHRLEIYKVAVNTSAILSFNVQKRFTKVSDLFLETRMPFS